MNVEAGSVAQASEQASSRALAGGTWTFVAYGASQVVRFSTNLVLARVLLDSRADFGVMAVATSIVQALQLFSDIGIWANLVQSPNGEKREFQDTIWTIQVLRGLLLFAIGWALVPVLAAAYPGMADLDACLQVSLVSILAGAFLPTAFHIAGRNLRLAAVTRIELGSQLVGSAAMIWLAMVLQSPVALAAGAPVIASCRVVLAWLLLGGANRLRWNREHASAIFRFGKWVSFSTILFYLTTHADRLLYGQLIPESDLGTYSIALALAWIPAEITTRISNSVVFPILCRLAQEGRDAPEEVARIRRPVLALGGWMFAGVAGGAPAAVALFYPPDFAPAGWIVPVLGIGLWFGAVLESSNGGILLAKGHPRWNTLASGAKLLAMLALLPVGWSLGRFPGAMAAYVAADVVRYLVVNHACRRLGVGTLRTDLVATTRMLGSAACCGAVAWWTMQQGMHPLVACCAVLIVATVTWLPGHAADLALVFRRRSVR